MGCVKCVKYRKHYSPIMWNQLLNWPITSQVTIDLIVVWVKYHLMHNTTAPTYSAYEHLFLSIKRTSCFSLLNPRYTRSHYNVFLCTWLASRLIQEFLWSRRSWDDRGWRGRMLLPPLRSWSRGLRLVLPDMKYSTVQYYVHSPRTDTTWGGCTIMKETVARHCTRKLKGTSLIVRQSIKNRYSLYLNPLMTIFKACICQYMPNIRIRHILLTIYFMYSLSRRFYPKWHMPVVDFCYYISYNDTASLTLIQMWINVCLLYMPILFVHIVRYATWTMTVASKKMVKSQISLRIGLMHVCVFMLFESSSSLLYYSHRILPHRMFQIKCSH